MKTKRNFKNALLTLAFLFVYLTPTFSQILNPVQWTFSYELKDDVVLVTASASIENKWKIYGTVLDEGGPNKTVMGLENTSDFLLEGAPEEIISSKKAYDAIFEMEISYWHDKAQIKQSYKIKNPEAAVLEGYVEYQACDDEQCLPPTQVPFTYNLEKGVPQKETSPTIIENADNLPIWHTQPIATQVEFASADHDARDKSLLMTFFLAFLGGLAALLTPCVFPMIPFTVSYFIKQSKSRGNGIRNAILYGVSIVGIYVLLGTGVVAIFGADSLNALSTNPWFNFAFFLLLVVFAASFMGAFEISLPSSWVNASDKGTDKGGFVGIFLMAFTLALVSFSCTGPIVGTLLVATVSSNSWIAPAIGMLGFSLALAIPFALFAAFPGWLNSLPKSGGWMNSVKVVLAFIELAMALKFLSIADMVLNLHILHRELFIAIWIVIALLLGLYVLGLLRLPHDSPNRKPNVLSIVVGGIVLLFAAYMVPGLWGGSIPLVSGFPPPSNYSESPFGLASNNVSMGMIAIVVICLICAGLLIVSLLSLNFIGTKEKRSMVIPVTRIFASLLMLSFFLYILPVFSGAPIKLISPIVPSLQVTLAEKPELPEHMHYGPQGIPSFDDYEYALAYAKKVNKPLFLDFTGVGCVNCRKVEDNVWSHQKIKDILANDYVLVSLQVDLKQLLPAEEQYVSPITGNKVKTIGNKWSDFQATRFRANSQPFYVVVDSDRSYIGTVKTMDLDVERYESWLLRNLDLYKNKEKNKK